jgi:serine/threonine protein kinase
MDGDPFDLVGDVLDGQFRVDAFAGEGDMSVVYRGHHIGVDATVAIKCLNLPATLDQALVEPLVASFREASRLHYRLARGNMNIAQCIAAGQTIAPRTGTTVPYLVREWFEGESLASELGRRRLEGKKGRSVDETVALLEPAALGMAYAHAHRALHLSFNPSNLFIATYDDDTRSLKVLDFGVARAMNELESDLQPDSHPSPGLRVLFPGYAAPEQLDRSVGEVGPSTDVYAIALVVMEVLSDRAVMGGSETGALVERALDERKRPTPQAHGLKLPSAVERVLARAVARAPGKRQKDAGALWNDLKSAMRGTGSRSMPAPRARSQTLAGVAPATVPPPVPPPAPQRAQIITAKLPPPLQPQPPARPVASLPFGGETPAAIARPNPSPLPPDFGLQARVRRPTGVSASFIAVTASVTGLLLAALVVLLVTWPKGRRESAAPAASDARVAAPEVTSVAPTAIAPSPTASGPESKARFSAFAAQRALDATARDVARCKRSSNWGVARASVTFATDGSVDHVLIGPPFTNTPTGQCVGEAMSSVHVPPFGGKPVVYIAQFFVPAR